MNLSAPLLHLYRYLLGVLTTSESIIFYFSNQSSKLQVSYTEIASYTKYAEQISAITIYTKMQLFSVDYLLIKFVIRDKCIVIALICSAYLV